jgi:hypothetical protein
MPTRVGEVMGFASIMRPDGTYDILGEPYAKDMVMYMFCSVCSKWRHIGATPVSADLIFACTECIEGKMPL